MRQRARITAREILKNHHPDPIPAEIDAAIRARFNVLLPENFV